MKHLVVFFFFPLKTEMKFLGTVLGIIEDTEAIG